MIEEYDKKYEATVNYLGVSLNPTYRASNRGEFEKILVYVKEDKAIGFIQYSKLYENVDICYIVVEEKYRGLGIGSEFLDYLSRDLDVKKINIEVRVSNEGAIAFYEKNGFTRVRPIKNYYKDGEDALAMEKVL